MPDLPDFDAWYRDDPDPFKVRTRWYERRKLALLLASLQRERYHAAWDPACGTGELAVALADRCEQVLATDVSARAVGITGARAAAQRNVGVCRHELPARPRRRTFDLVVVSEVLYYLPASARAQAIALLDAVTAAAASAEVVSVHWRHLPHDAQVSGAAVTDEIDQGLRARGWAERFRHDDVDFVLGGWSKAAEEPP